jgi:hypothetical protein
MARKDDSQNDIECPVCGTKVSADKKAGGEDALDAHMKREHETTAKVDNPKP